MCPAVTGRPELTRFDEAKPLRTAARPGNNDSVDADDASRSAMAWLAPAFARLDRLLTAAVASAEQTFGFLPGAEPLRGSHITREEIDRLLQLAPGASPLRFERSRIADDIDGDGVLAHLVRQFGLTAFDVDALLVALAPELDVRYERVYAFLQGDVSRRVPSIDLILTLLCETPEERIARRSRFGADAPLVRQQLVHIVSEAARGSGSQLARSVVVDSQIVAALFGDESLDHRLAPSCRLVRTRVVDTLALEQAGLSWVLEQRDDNPLVAPVRLFLHGADDDTRRACCAALAASLGVVVFWCDVALAIQSVSNLAEVLRLAVRDAWLRGALLAISTAELLDDAANASARAALINELASLNSGVVFEATRPWPVAGRDSLGVVDIPIAPLGVAARHARWQRALAARGVQIADDAIQGLAGRMRLSSSQIDDAVAIAMSRARLRASDARQPMGDVGIDDLAAGARSLIQRRLPAIARKTPLAHDWNSLVLPADTIAQLRELAERAAQSERVLESWGGTRTLSTGRGVTALFSGAPGTGKTMAAQLIAGELGLDLYRIDVAGVVSRYIGETEKNLDAIFTAAEHSSAVLFFDEADALFGKRSEVKDAHDRYGNIEVSYLLQKMEEHHGVAILATNIVGPVDGALLRRLTCCVHFPFPDEGSRARIWSNVWPPEVKLDEKLDLDSFAHHFELSGGEIRSVALGAAHLAAAGSGIVSAPLLRHALRREYSKLGRIITDDELSAILAGQVDVAPDAMES